MSFTFKCLQIKMFSQVSSALGDAANSKVITITESVPDKVIYNSWLPELFF